MAFELAESLTKNHLIVQPSDAVLDPPQSYLFVQDFLIIACGVLYALCYFFYMIRTYRDKVLAGPVEFLSGTMAYEIYYAWTCTSTTSELVAFFIWFLFDVTFASIAIKSAYPASQRAIVALRTAIGVPVCVAGLWYLSQLFPDDREQTTAFWTGWILELPIGWGSVIILLWRGDTKGQSLEIWATRILGVLTAEGVFYWRYLNVPQNWVYVGESPGLAIFWLTLLPEILFPFVYLRVHKQSEDRKPVAAYRPEK